MKEIFDPQKAIEDTALAFPICEYCFGDTAQLPFSDKVWFICETDCERYGAFIEPLYHPSGLACNIVTGEVRELPYSYRVCSVTRKRLTFFRLSVKMSVKSQKHYFYPEYR